MTAEKTPNKTRYQRAIRHFKDIGDTTPQWPIDSTVHRIRQSCIFNEGLKDNVLTPITRNCFQLEQSREANYKPPRLHWLLALTLMLLLPGMMYLLLQCG